MNEKGPAHMKDSLEKGRGRGKGTERTGEVRILQRSGKGHEAYNFRELSR